jgi:hypothetical protein
MLDRHDEHSTIPRWAQHYVRCAPTRPIWKKARVPIVNILDLEHGDAVSFELRFVLIIEKENIDVNHGRP